MLPRLAPVAGVTALGLLPAAAPSAAQERPPFRPPAVPLVTCDPYFSVWSMSDRLTDEWSRHWTGAVQAMCGLARIDGQTYRWMGPEPSTAPAVEQRGVVVLPTRTIYEFVADGLSLTVTFTAPALPDDLDVYGWPVTYVTWEARSTDGAAHEVSLYLDCTAEWVVNTPDQAVTWDRVRFGGLTALRAGSADQPVLGRAGDDLRIEWGYLYLAVPDAGGQQNVMTSHAAARGGFAADGRLPERDDGRMPRAASDDWPVLAWALDLGPVGEAPVSRYAVLAYDDVWSIELLGTRLRPYWRRNGWEAADLLQAAVREYPALRERCRAFDEELVADLRGAGGEPYARLAALVYRECVAAHKLAAGTDGAPLLFPKECFSNGCISTVDVIYPSAPFFLLLNTELLRAQLTPLLDYAESPRWPHPFAPHDLGTYPLANGQVYGDGEHGEENQMPVEESGNMLLLLAALAQADGHADYARRYWPLLARWAAYLREKGLDPENQLCTDDFTGHLAHNTNLSLKATCALGAYAQLCEQVGEAEQGRVYRQVAEEMARTWLKRADDGDHYRLAFDQPGTWSQKYNLVWDRLLGLGLFPEEAVRREWAYYRTQLRPYGLPLDNRRSYTKLDWELWTATVADGVFPGDFADLVARVYRFANESPSRAPLTDWYDTETGVLQGFRARSVVGAVYIKMLDDRARWQRWSARAHG